MSRGVLPSGARARECERERETEFDERVREGGTSHRRRWPARAVEP